MKRLISTGGNYRKTGGEFRTVVTQTLPLFVYYSRAQASYAS